jgi:PAS domain S-box-containing protein
VGVELTRERVLSVAFAVVAVGVAALTRYLLSPLLDDRTPFLTFFVAVLICSVWRDTFSGSVALVLSALAAEVLFINPKNGPVSLRDGAGLGLFLILGASIVHYLGRNLRSFDEMRRTLSKLDSAMAVSGVGTWEVDLRVERVRASPTVNKLFGFPADSEERPVAEYVAQVHPEDRKCLLSEELRVRPPGTPLHREYRVVRPDGSFVWIDSRGSVISGPDGEKMVGALFDVTARKQGEEQRKLVTEEALHRTRNAFALVQSIAHSTLTIGPQQERLTERIQALAEGYTLSLTGTDSADLRAVIEAELKPFDLGRVSLYGDRVTLPPECVMGMGLVVHELASNAAKHGGLSVSTGRIIIQWTEEDGTLRLTWSETGGPPVREPESLGFGSKLIRSALGRRGTVTEDFWPEGLVAKITLDLKASEH